MSSYNIQDQYLPKFLCFALQLICFASYRVFYVFLFCVGVELIVYVMHVRYQYEYPGGGLC